MATEKTSRSKQQPDMFQSGSPGSAKKTARRGPKHQKGTQALERLRDRIELAVKELHRLREDNQLLQRELEAVRRHGLDGVEGTTVVFNESPSTLRKKIESYISTIDRQIEQVEAEQAAPPSEPGP